ncbi:MAG: IcmT/TraK family protein [Gluconacetobacter sp.]
MKRPKTTWRYTAEPVMLGVIDARALIFASIWFLHMRLYTFIISLVGIAVFSVLAWLKISPAVALRMLRVSIVGPLRPHIPSTRRRDYIR